MLTRWHFLGYILGKKQLKRFDLAAIADQLVEEHFDRPGEEEKSVVTP